jgi:DNA-binding cell septation regulator SpoVG
MKGMTETSTIARDEAAHRISEVRIRPVPDGRDGLIAFVSCRYGDVLLNDIAVRRDEVSRLYLSWPRKVGATGRPHPLHHPLTKEAAAAFETAILGTMREMFEGVSR